MSNIWTCEERGNRSNIQKKNILGTLCQKAKNQWVKKESGRESRNSIIRGGCRQELSEKKLQKKKLKQLSKGEDRHFKESTIEGPHARRI